jgi:hypothetical protein
MDIGFDFFLFIAFFIPGIFILYSVSLVSESLRNFISNGFTGKESSKWILVFSLCILFGMISSIVRNITVDRTYLIDFSNWYFAKGKADWARIAMAEPSYSNLSKDNLEVLKELKNEEKRPYQFYGNTIIAFTCFIICILILCIRKNTRLAWKQFAYAFVVYLFFSWVLYIGSRFSHYNYMEGVKQLNEKVHTS